MKEKILCALLLITSALLHAQKEGNGHIIPYTKTLPSFTRIDVSFNAQIIINCDTTTYLRITTDQNLMEDIEMSVIKNTLVLEQKEWIEPSREVKIFIGAPDLTRIEQSTHQTTTILNIDKEFFEASAQVGAIILKGRTKTLNASVETGDIIADELIVSKVNIDSRGWGKIKLGWVENITGSIKENGQLTYQNDLAQIDLYTPEKGIVKLEEQPDDNPNNEAKYIEIKLKNNSLKFINAFVIGPKPNGGSFSYGFNLFPGQVKKERWTVGTKIYKERKRGSRELFREITENDENQIVKIYN